MYIKRKLKKCRFQIQVKKNDILKKKNQFFDFFFDFFSFGVRALNFVFSNFSKFQKKFFKNGLNGTYRILKETKSRNMSSFGASCEKSR